MAIVTLNNVVKEYTLGKTIVPAVNGVSFDIDSGDFVSIVGPSGSGKSTILNMIGCIDIPTQGIVEVDGIDTATLNDFKLTELRRSVLGFIFQSFNLLPVLNVTENIAFPLNLNSKKLSKEQKKENSEYIEYLIEEVGLTRWKTHKPSELSGGQRQRVAIARALVTKPLIVLADEPTANLDSKTGEDIITLMKKINEDLHTTFIFSTHDEAIFSNADHIIQLKDGHVEKNYRPKS